MAWPDLLDLRTKVRSVINEATAGLWSDVELNRYLNDGERDIAEKVNCYTSMVSAVTTVGSRLVPFTGHKVRYVEFVPAVGNPISIVPITPKMLGNIPINDGALPQYWFSWGGNIVIEPIPTSICNLNVYISSWPDYDLVDSTDEPKIPVEFHESICLYSEAFAMMKQNRMGTAIGLYRQYITEIDSRMKIYGTPRMDRDWDMKRPSIVKEPEREKA